VNQFTMHDILSLIYAVLKPLLFLLETQTTY
jgi:hypothetical protein